MAKTQLSSADYLSQLREAEELRAKLHREYEDRQVANEAERQTSMRRSRLANELKRRELPYVFITKPRCPKCGAAELARDGFTDDPDGSTTCYATCKTEECKTRFKIVAE